MLKKIIMTTFLLLQYGCIFAKAHEGNVCDSTKEMGAYQKVKGILRVIIKDDFARNQSNKFISLEEDATHDLINIDYNAKDTSIINENIGKSVELEGYQIDRQFCVKSIQTIQEKIEFNAPQSIQGVRRALVLMASRIPGASVPETLRNDIKKAIEDDSPGAPSVNNVYQQSSYGRLGFKADVAGPFLVQSTGCSWWEDLTAAKVAAQSAGINLENYNHYILVYGDSTAIDVRNQCGSGGYAFVNGQDSANFFALSNRIYIHELGHNLGMEHAYQDPSPTYDCTWRTCIEYGDPTDFMGRPTSQIFQNNAIHRILLGWLPPQAVQDVTQEGSYVLYPLENDPSVTQLGPSVIRFPRQNVSEEQFYYLSYRIPKDFDTNLPVGQNQLHIHYKGPSSIGYFITTLTSGQSFEDPLHRVFIKNIRYLANGSIGFDISFGQTIKFKLSPKFTTLKVGSQLSFDTNESVQVSDGRPPYTYSSSLNSFEISETTYIYKATQPGLDTITVTDSNGKTASALVTIGYMDFGGMYGYSRIGNYINPITGAYNCPSGYTARPIMGTTNVDYPLYYCYRMHTDGVPADYDFGGIYSLSGTGLRPNPLTGAASCPSGYTSAQVFGENTQICQDYPVYFCYKTHNETIAETAPFAGMYAPAWYTAYNHPITGGQNCPSGTYSTMMLGTLNVDYPFYFCTYLMSSLKLTPQYTNLALNNTMSFDANDTVRVTGGVPPYTYSANFGTFTRSGNTYTYTATKPGLDTIKVTDSNNNTATAKITVALMDFGGMYGYGSVNFNNPVTGALSCPSGYTAQQVLGTNGVDYPLYYCYRTHIQGVAADYDFGGMFSSSLSGARANPITGASSCPQGYKSTQVFGQTTGYPDYPVYMCHKPHNESVPEAAHFAGMYGYGYYENFKNPATNALSCPIGWTPAMMLDTYRTDYPFYFCF